MSAGRARADAPRVLVIAGRDPSGGAGVDADAEAIAAVGARALLCVSAETDQDERGVRAVRPVNAGGLERRAVELLERERPGALKLGLLPDAAAIEAAARVAALARAGGVAWTVLDPVLAPTRGPRFHGPGGVALLLDSMGGLDLVWTPNVPELAELCAADGDELAHDAAARERAACELLERGARAVVLKGGHALAAAPRDSGPPTAAPEIEDLLVSRCGPPRCFRRPRLPGPGIRGSGCRFASHLAADLAHGRPLAAAVGRAGEYLAARIAAAGEA